MLGIHNSILKVQMTHILSHENNRQLSSHRQTQFQKLPELGLLLFPMKIRIVEIFGRAKFSHVCSVPHDILHKDEECRLSLVIGASRQDLAIPVFAKSLMGGYLFSYFSFSSLYLNTAFSTSSRLGSLCSSCAA